ncbi:hypothetical protein [Paenibacillus ihuae]|uniref:hypothetical protein n=1 Tax=Paenibacillus ihuae TaxID=1232431 RepID=UPI0006D5467E|nr:hypothetical protein [Paenibacillus ihuae]
MHVRIHPKIESADTESQLYPMVFRMSRWNYVIAAFTVAVSLFFIWLGFFESEMTLAVLLTALGIILLGFNVMYIIQVKNAFIELNKDTVRYRKYRRIITFDLDQIYVELLEDAFFLYSPQHTRIDIGNYFTNSTLLHSLLYKHSEENISRIKGTPHEDFTGFKSFTGNVSSINKRKQLLSHAAFVLLFIGGNIVSYLNAPEREFIYHFLFFIGTGTGYGVALYTGRRRGGK